MWSADRLATKALNIHPILLWGDEWLAAIAQQGPVEKVKKARPATYGTLTIDLPLSELVSSSRVVDLAVIKRERRHSDRAATKAVA